MLSPSTNEIISLQSKIITRCFPPHQKATLASFFVGVKDIMDKDACGEIADEYIILFRNLVSQVSK